LFSGSSFAVSAEQVGGREESADPEAAVAIDHERVPLDVDLLLQRQPVIKKDGYCFFSDF
jgi:hypothetical protein